MTDVGQPAAPTATQSRRPGGWRALIDTLVCLYVAVILFRTFEVEGYIISTGSMAPTLLGFHKRVVCPSCQYPFAFGVAVDIAGAAADSDGDHKDRSRRAEFDAGRGHDGPGHDGMARCPNCGRDGIDVDGIPVNHGDQLLVLKHAYEFRAPKRWEVVVLQSPQRPIPPFVKRIVGLPNETVQIVNGDIYINGEIARKDLDRQRAMRILVFDNDHIPNDLRPGSGGWIAEQARQPWQAHGTGFEIKSTPEDGRDAGSAETAWLGFRPIRRSKSRAQVVMDDYGYNRSDAGLLPMPVRDLMLECEVLFRSRDGEMMFEIDGSGQIYRLTIDRTLGEARLAGSQQTSILRKAPLPSLDWSRPVRVELSVIDRQVLCALDGAPLFAACEFPGDPTPPRQTPVRIGAAKTSAELTSLKIYRDVYYTRGQGYNGVDRPIDLGSDEYFVLGDNSPVSNDARSWPEGAVRLDQLLGKPLVVHLPSRPGEFHFGGRTHYIRIPDFSRMRYIH